MHGSLLTHPNINHNWSSRKHLYTNEVLEHDIREHHEALTKAIRRYGHTRGLMDKSEIKHALGILSDRYDSSLRLMNPYSRRLIHKLVNHAMTRYDCQDLKFVTILHEPWHFSDRCWHFDVVAIRQEVQEKCRGLNFLFFIDLAVFTNVRSNDGGRVIAPHIHGLVWGSMSKRQKKKVARQFAGGLFGADPVRCDDVYNLPGAVSYSIKAPYKGTRVRPRKDRTPLHRSDKLSLAQHFHLFFHLQHLSHFDMAFAGGEGISVFKTIRRLAHNRDCDWHQLDIFACERTDDNAASAGAFTASAKATISIPHLKAA